MVPSKNWKRSDCKYIHFQAWINAKDYCSECQTFEHLSSKTDWIPGAHLCTKINGNNHHQLKVLVHNQSSWVFITKNVISFFGYDHRRTCRLKAAYMRRTFLWYSIFCWKVKHSNSVCSESSFIDYFFEFYRQVFS